MGTAHCWGRRVRAPSWVGRPGFSCLLCHWGVHVILESLKLSSLKSRELKLKSPKTNLFKLWSSLVEKFLIFFFF